MDTRYRTYPIAATCAAALLAGAMSPAPAQSRAQEKSPQEASNPESAGKSDEELKAYALAALEVNRLSTVWQPRIGQADSPNEAEEMRNQATEEMVAAIENEGLTIEEYNEIYNLAQSNPQVREAINKHLDDAR